MRIERLRPFRLSRRRGLKISHCFSRKLRWILFERDETVANVILMTLNIRNYRFVAIFLRISTKWKLDKSIVRPAHSNKSIVRPWADNRFVTVSWADNRFVQFSLSRNPQKNCNKPIVSDIQSHENNVCDRFVSLEQNSSQLSWETMTYFQPSPSRETKWSQTFYSHDFSYQWAGQTILLSAQLMSLLLCEEGRQYIFPCFI